MQELGQLPDVDLVALLTQRSEAALGELFRRHARSVALTSQRILASSHDAEDVVAEVFLALWMSPHGFDPAQGSLLGFLRMKARGKSIDIVRSASARSRRERKISMDPAVTRIPETDRHDSEGIMEALAALPRKQREPIELAFFEEMTYRAIAAHLGIPEGTTKARIRTGLRHLRESMEIQTQIFHPSARTAPTDAPKG